MLAHRRATKRTHAGYERLGVDTQRIPTLMSALREQRVLAFTYNGQPRVVEPQAYGLSVAGKHVLRAYQRSGGSHSNSQEARKLFEVAKNQKLRKTNERFAGARPGHNPNDSARLRFLPHCWRFDATCVASSAAVVDIPLSFWLVNAAFRAHPGPPERAEPACCCR